MPLNLARTAPIDEGVGLVSAMATVHVDMIAVWVLLEVCVVL